MDGDDGRIPRSIISAASWSPTALTRKVLLWLRGTYRAYPVYQQQVPLQILAGGGPRERAIALRSAPGRTAARRRAALRPPRRRAAAAGRGRRGRPRRRRRERGHRRGSGRPGSGGGGGAAGGRRRRRRRAAAGGGAADRDRRSGGRRGHRRRGRPTGAGGGRRGAAAGGGGGGGIGGAPPAARPARAPTSRPSTTRSDTVINSGWKHLRMDNSGAPATAFNDTAWASVTLPHTWNATDGQDGGSNYYRGIGWYRRHYTPPASAAGKRIFLQFDGATSSRRLRQRHDGRQHRGGFARFRFDVTAAMTPRQRQRDRRAVSNAAVSDVAPLDADFTFFGGLYRAVHVLVTDPVHVDALDFASSGVYVSPTDVSAAQRHPAGRVRVRNDQTPPPRRSPSTPSSCAPTARSRRADGVQQRRRRNARALSASAAFPTRTCGTASPIPTSTRVYAEVRVGGRRRPTSCRCRSAFASFRVDAAQGFSLNGQYLDLHGVNRHQDRLNMGWAITNAQHDEDMALIHEMGANVVRLSHYQQAELLPRLADRAGIVLWAEIPLVNGITDTAAFTTNAAPAADRADPPELQPPVDPVLGHRQRAAQPTTPPTNTLLTALNTLAHQEDPGRLSTYAQCCTSDTGGLPAHTDVVGYNTYYGWYDAFGTADQFGAWADNLHAAKPTWKIGVSEYGAGAGITQHADNPPAPDPYGTPHPEEWQNLVHESHWKQMKTRRYLWAKIDLEHVRLRRRQPQRGRHARAQRQGPGHLRPQDQKGRLLLVQGELDDGAVRLHHVTPVQPAHDADRDREGLLEHGFGAPAGERHDDRDLRRRRSHLPVDGRRAHHRREHGRRDRHERHHDRNRHRHLDAKLAPTAAAT